VFFYSTDHLGSTVLVANHLGQDVWRGDTSPFGDSVSGSGELSDSERLKYTGKDYDEDIGLYHFNARWYDADTARFVSEDPAQDGVSWFAYVGNNPLKYVDPTGLRQVQEAITEGEEDEVNIDGLRYIIDKRLSAAIDLANSISQDHSVSSKFQFNNENLPKLFSMIGIYNRRIVPDSIDDYLKDGRISEDFDASQTYLTGDYQTSAHYGIDGVPDEEIPEASGDFHSPWYTILDSTNTGGSNPFVLQVIGTDIRIRVKHADKEDLPSFNRIYRPNETIVVFPERNNSNLPSSSTARHIHFETTRGGEHAWQRYLVDPVGLERTTVQYQFTLDGWNTSRPVNTAY
jgi:RHS repeat-associated protein